VFNRTEETKMTDPEPAAGTPARPLTLLQQVREERRRWSEEVDRLNAEAAELALQQEQASEPLPLLYSHKAELEAEYNRLAAERDTLAGLGIGTVPEASERPAGVEDNLSRVAADLAHVEAKIDEIQCHVNALVSKEFALRLEAQRVPEGLILRERDAALDEVHKARISLLVALERLVRWNSNFPPELLNGTWERQADLGGPSVESLMPAHLRGLHPVRQTDGLLDGIDDLLKALANPQSLPPSFVEDLAREAGVDISDLDR
jgi:hypothetical protein